MKHVTIVAIMVVCLAALVSAFKWGQFSALTPLQRQRLSWAESLSVDMIDVLEEKSLTGVTILPLNPSFGGVYADACQILKDEDAAFVEDVDDAMYTIDVRSSSIFFEKSLIIIIADSNGLIEKQIVAPSEEFERDLQTWARKAGARHKRAVLKMMNKEKKHRSYPIQSGVVPL